SFTVTSVALIKPTRFLAIFTYCIILRKPLDISDKLLFNSSPSYTFFTVNVRNNQRTVGFCLITSATTFCDWMPCFIALLQLHIGQSLDLQNHTRYNFLSPVSRFCLYSNISAQSFTLSALLNSRICRSS